MIKLKDILKETASKEAMGIAGFTGTRGIAVQKFIDDFNLNSKKLFNFIAKGKLKDRMDFTTAISGKPGNKYQGNFVGMFGESTVTEVSLQKGKTYGGTKCEGGCYMGKEGLKKIIKISKDNPNNIFIFRDDNYSGLQPHFIKNGVIAKANTIGNPSYDLQNKKLRNLNIGKDVILSVRLFEGVNESIMTEGVWSKIMMGVRKGSQSGPWTIVIIQNKKVIHQEPVRVKDAIPASYEGMKRKFRNAVLSIEDKQGQIVYSERI
jgi:hypothetical protein